MTDDKPLKSAYELAMERLNRRDAESGETVQPLTDDQKARIAEIRNVFETKIAEQEIMHQSRLRRTLDPSEREALQAEFRRERERLASERESKIEKVRTGARR